MQSALTHVDTLAHTARTATQGDNRPSDVETLASKVLETLHQFLESDGYHEPQLVIRVDRELARIVEAYPEVVAKITELVNEQCPDH